MAQQTPGKVESGARQPVEEIKAEGQRLGERAKAQLEQLAADRKNDASSFLHDVSSALEQGAGTLHDQGRENSASLFDKAAKDLGDLAQEVSRREPLEMLRELESFAQRRPAIFYGAALLAGFGAVRFLRSSAEEARPKHASSASDAELEAQGAGQGGTFT